MSGRDDPPAGYPNGRPNGDPSEMPADLAAVQSDDLLLDMLGSAGRAPGDVDGELTRVLAAWRREVHADSNRMLVDTDTAVAVISAARRPIRRRSPIFGPIAAAAAVLVISFSAVGLVAKSAQPGDNLWGVTEVLYSDYARSVETAASVRTELEQAKKALQENKPEQAQASLDRIRQQLPVIAEAEGKTDLTTQHRELEQRLDADPSAQGAPPGSPDVSSSKQLEPAPLDPSSATTPSTQPDSTTSTEPSPSTSPEPIPTPSTSPEPTPSPGPDSYPGPAKPAPPVPTTPPGPDDESTQPRAQPIRTSPSDFIPPPPPPPPNSPPMPPSGVPEKPSAYGDPADPDLGPGPIGPDQPRAADAGQPPASATTASAYPLQYSQLT